MHEPARAGVSAGEAGMFLLEIVGLVGMGRLGWHLGTGTAWKVVLAVGFVAVTSALWTMARARGFVPSGDEPIIAVPGPVRLLIEYGFYLLGAVGLWLSGWEIAAGVFAAGVLVVSVALRDRLAGLLANRPPKTGA